MNNATGRFHLRTRAKPNVPKVKKKKEPDSCKTTATPAAVKEKGNDVLTEANTNTVNQSISGNSSEPVGIIPSLESPQTENVDTSITPAESNKQDKKLQSSQDDSASSADESKKSKVISSIPRLGRSKYKPYIPKKAAPKPTSNHGPSQAQDSGPSLHKPTILSVPLVTSEVNKSPSTTNLQVERPELPVSPAKHLVPAAPHCVPPPLDPSSSEDEGVIDPYDPSNPQGAKGEHERGRHRKNQRIIKTFSGGKPRAMIDYLFYNPKTNPMIHSETETTLPPDSREEKEEDEDDPDVVPTFTAPTPKIIISADGKLTVDKDSLTVETAVAREGRKALSKNPVTLATSFGGRLKRRPARILWSKEETVFFYKCLSTVGADFEAIRRYFPGRDRHHIKLKFKLEERQLPALVTKALNNSHYNTAALEEEFRQVHEKAQKEREDKKNRRTKGTKTPRAPAKPRTPRKKKGPRNRTDYFLEESGEGSSEGEDGPSSSEEDEDMAREMEAHMSERKPCREALRRIKQEPRQAARVERAAPVGGPQTSVNVETLPSTVAYLDITESHDNAERTLDPEELLGSDVVRIFNPTKPPTPDPETSLPATPGPPSSDTIEQTTSGLNRDLKEVCEPGPEISSTTSLGPVSSEIIATPSPRDLQTVCEKTSFASISPEKTISASRPFDLPTVCGEPVLATLNPETSTPVTPDLPSSESIVTPYRYSVVGNDLPVFCKKPVVATPNVVKIIPADPGRPSSNAIGSTTPGISRDGQLIRETAILATSGPKTPLVATLGPSSSKIITTPDPRDLQLVCETTVIATPGPKTSSPATPCPSSSKIITTPGPTGPRDLQLVRETTVIATPVPETSSPATPCSKIITTPDPRDLQLVGSSTVPAPPSPETTVRETTRPFNQKTVAQILESFSLLDAKTLETFKAANQSQTSASTEIEHEKTERKMTVTLQTVPNCEIVSTSSKNSFRIENLISDNISRGSSKTDTIIEGSMSNPIIIRKDSEDSNSVDSSILTINSNSVAVPSTSRTPDRISRRKAPIILKIPVEGEPIYIDNLNPPSSPPQQPCKKTPAKKAITKKVEKVVTPEPSIEDDDSEKEFMMANESDSTEHDSTEHDSTEHDSSDSEQMEMEFLAREPKPTRFGRLPRKSEQMPMGAPAKRQKVELPFPPPATPSPEPSEADSSFSEDHPGAGSLILVTSQDEEEEHFQLFMIPPHSGGTTLEHNPDGSLQRLTFGSSQLVTPLEGTSLPGPSIATGTIQRMREGHVREEQEENKS